LYNYQRIWEHGLGFWSLDWRPPRQYSIIYPSIPPLDSLPIPSVTNPSIIAYIPANSYILVPVTTHDVVIGFMVSQGDQVDSYYRLGVHE
jgi:hypothetical protein